LTNLVKFDTLKRRGGERETKMTSTTTCSYGNPLITKVTGGNFSLILPEANNQNFQWGTSTCVTVSPTQTVTLLGGGTVEGGFTYGEIVIAFFLLLLVCMTFFGGVLNRVIGVKQKPNLYGSK